MSTSLGDALTSGRGIERPFQCPEHDDHNASASVNVIKGVWFCYGCQAKGVVDSGRVPTPDELASMLTPEDTVREYAQSWLAVFGVGGYWLDRFPAWVCWQQGFGDDPWTGEGTYPVHTPGGRLAGVGRRSLSTTGPKYRYPKHWAASRSLFGTRGAYRHGSDVVLLTEGAADAAAGWEVGCLSVAAYGSGLHHPQVELVLKMTPRLVLLGQDADEAGERGAAQSRAWLENNVECARVRWDESSDPAAMEPGARLDVLIEAVAGSGYGQAQAIRDSWRTTKSAVRSAYEQEHEHG